MPIYDIFFASIVKNPAFTALHITRTMLTDDKMIQPTTDDKWSI